MNPRVLLATVVAIVAIVPIAAPPFYVTLFNYIGLYSISVLGLVVLTGVAGQTSFGQAAFVGLGAYTTAYLTTGFGISPWLTLLIALALTALIAYVLGFITLRLKGHYLPLGTIAWGISLYYLFGTVPALGGHTGITGIPALNFFGLELKDERAFYVLIWLVVFASLWATHNLLDSRPGRAMRALKNRLSVVEAFGVDAAKLKIVVFVYAALLASVSGWLYAHLQRFVNPTPFGINAGIEYLFMAVVGGAGSVWGALIGASVITVAKQLLQDWLPALLGRSGQFETIVFGVLIVLMLQYAPSGIWPWISKKLISKQVHTRVSVEKPLHARNQPSDIGALLTVEQARKTFGGLVAVNDISFELRAREILALIGPNGAGKSTLFNLLSGALEPSAGRIEFVGRDIAGKAPFDIAPLGLARTFQHVKLIADMSVNENVALGAHLRASAGVVASAFGLNAREESALRAESERQLKRCGLSAYADQAAGSLPLGLQRIVEIARALAADPVLLLLDEPAAGLRGNEKQQLATLLQELRAQGMSILLVEHDMDFVMGLADRLVVMNFGHKLAEGSPRDVQRDAAVREAYLGA